MPHTENASQNYSTTVAFAKNQFSD